MDLAKLLRKQIDATGESLHAVAKGAGISYPVVYRFYHGQRSIMLETVEKLCRYLKLKLTPRAEKQRTKGGK